MYQKEYTKNVSAKFLKYISKNKINAEVKIITEHK